MFKILDSSTTLNYNIYSSKQDTKYACKSTI